MHDAHTRFLASPPSWQAEVWYCDAEQAAHALQLPDVRVPPEVQTCAPAPARARIHRWSVCGGAKAYGAGVVRHGARDWAVWWPATARGPRVTCSELLYVPEEQAEQPALQDWSQSLGAYSSQSQLEAAIQSSQSQPPASTKGPQT